MRRAKITTETLEFTAAELLAEIRNSLFNAGIENIPENATLTATQTHDYETRIVISWSKDS